MSNRRLLCALPLALAACQSPAEAPQALIQPCTGSTAALRPLIVSWGFDGTVELANGAPLRVSNPGDEPAVVTLTTRFLGANARIDAPAERFELAAHATRELTITTEALARVATTSDTPFTVRVVAEVGGSPVHAELRFLHAGPKNGTFTWYAEKDLAAQNRRLIERLLSERRVEVRPYEQELLGNMQFVTGGQGGPLPEGAPPPPDGQTVCFRWSTDFVEGGVDFASLPIHPARGAKIWLTVPFLGTWFGMASRSSGCVTFPALPAGSIFFMGLYSEVHVGNNPDRDFMIRAFDAEGTGEGLADWDETPGDVPRTAFMLQSLGGGTSVTVTSAPGRWRMANMLAVAGELFAFYDAQVGDPTPQPMVSYVYQVANCPTYPNSSCAGNGYAWMSDFDGNLHKAELIGHETGHLVEQFFSSAIGPSNFDHEDPVEVCSGYGRVHVLNSKEYQTAAFKEGFASALGAFALSTSPSWRYYANIPESNGEYTNQVVVLDDPASFDRLENACGAADMAGFGVESDWLRFYWDYWHSAGMGMAEYFQIHADGSAAMDITDAYHRLEMAMPGGAKRMYFQDRAAVHGIDAQ